MGFTLVWQVLVLDLLSYDLIDLVSYLTVKSHEKHPLRTGVSPSPGPTWTEACRFRSDIEETNRILASSLRGGHLI